MQYFSDREFREIDRRSMGLTGVYIWKNAGLTGVHNYFTQRGSRILATSPFKPVIGLNGAPD